MPEFKCKICGRTIRAEYDFYCTGCAVRTVEKPFEKAPVCCGKSMLEIIE